MDAVYARCAGLDVPKKSVVACVLVSEGGRPVREAVRTFGTMAQGLVASSDWVRASQVEQVALESTGVCWWPVFNILEEGGHAVLLVNPQHAKQVPGRKTDVKDSEWLAELLRHGLLQASFIPPAAIRDLRDLTRYRATHVRLRSAESQRLQKVLEGANLKLAAVASDVLGVKRTAAAAILAGAGADMGQFPSAAHLARWAGVCPGNKRSGGKRLSSKTTNGNVWLRGILGEVARAAIRTEGTSFGARYRRLCRRLGKQQALVAVMHNLLTVIYYILRDQAPYRELGPDSYQQGKPERTTRRLVQHLEHPGFTVTLEATPAA